MVQVWSPTSQLQRSPEPGVWIIFDKSKRIAIVRVVEVQGNSRRFLGDRIFRTVKPHSLLDPAHGPLIAVRLWIVTRKSLGGIQTDLSGRAMDATGRPIEGLYAAGEAAGFGGGGAHGYNALEGTFLGGCLFTGRTVGRALAAAL
ncbi:FAD-binding protein [Microbacterium sp. NPDC089180]|uniref:FAD-binding protein n=1 Tax=unclassified Microbacterium TaxID=2609290 RepID=UPI00342B9E31